MSADTEKAAKRKAKASLPRDAVKTVEERHSQRKSWFLSEASRQAPNRAMMAKCERFYDSEQWDRDDAQAVEDRGQRAIVYNEVKPTIDWLIGTERRSRVDFYVVAEDDDPAADDDAILKTKALKYLDDVNRAGFERSYAAEDMFKAGLGWLEVGLRGDKSGVPIYIGAESWRNILYDSQSIRRDLSDARYLFRLRIADLDVAQAIFPDKLAELDRCVQEGDDPSVFSTWLNGNGLIAGIGQQESDSSYLDGITSRPVDIFNPRKRVMLIECWSREPQRRPLGTEGLGDPVEFKIRLTIMTETDTLLECWSPFDHDRFPFIPLWAYKNRRTGLPYGPIRPILGPQEALNHRMSKSIMEASMNQLKIEEGAIATGQAGMDINELREELSSPDGIAIFANGALSGRKVQERPAGGAAGEQLRLADREIVTIRGVSGVTGESRGMETNSISGKAVIAKQEQGGLVTAELFDNLLLARQLEGEMTLSLAEQFWRAQTTIRVAGEGANVSRVRMNVPQADGTYLNDITARRAHFVVGEQAWKQAYAEAAFQSLMELLTQLAASAPQMVVNLLDVVFEMHPNLPKKRAILERIRAVNGQTDPEGKATPEQMQAQQQKQAAAKAQFDAQMAQLQADISVAKAQGTKLEAEAMAKRLEALYISAQAAQVLAAMPLATPVADELLRSAGFVDANGQGSVIPVDPNAQPVPMQQGAGGPTVPTPPSPLQGDGQAQGIQTTAADGLQPA